MDVAILVPAGREAEVGRIDASFLLPYGTALDLVVSLRAISNPAVIWSDGLVEDSLDAVAAAVRDHAAPCIEVRSEKWDGQSFSVLSAACRGVVSGFGASGVIAAARLAAAQ